MIDRYSRPELRAIWSDQSRYNTWLEIEGYIIEGLASKGFVKGDFIAKYKSEAKVSEYNIEELEKDLKHDILAFLHDLANSLGNTKEARFIHYGVTSSDILDTCLSVQLAKANGYIYNNLHNLVNALYRQAKKYRNTLCVGRSHGIHAEPTTFGIKLLNHCAIFARCLEKLRIAIEECKVCKISGAVGNFAHISPDIESHVAQQLGFHADQVSTQVIARDRHAFLFSVYGLIASAIENIATEIRHLQRSEVSEALEAFSSQQKGSSAMPHKKNPILSENLTGLARLIRAYVIPAMENIALWHERDISHSSVERINCPSATMLLDFALIRTINVIENMHVDVDCMLKNLKLAGNSIFSQKIMLLIIKNSPNVTRDKVYRVIQRNIKNKSTDELINTIHHEFPHISQTELHSCFKYDSYISNIDSIFKKFYKSYGGLVVE